MEHQRFRKGGENMKMLDETIVILEDLGKYFEKKAAPRIQFRRTRQALVVASECAKMQIPKKPINKTKPDDYASLAYENCNIVVCPTCNGRLKLKSKGNYCDKCGQSLDWSDKESEE